MILQTQNLTVGYGGCAVLEAVNLDLKPGEILCLLGRNGSGKSSLIKTLLTLIRPLGGNILVNGRSIQTLSGQAISRTMAYVPQAHADLLGFTVGEIVLMGRTLHWGLFGGPSSLDHDLVVTCLQQLGIAELQNRDFNLLSGGQQQLVLIARALCQGADLLILDEPTANLDLANSARVLNILSDLAAQGKTIVFSSHNPQDALNRASTTCLLKNRTVLAQGPSHQVITSDNLSQVYGTAVNVCNTENGQKVVVQA